MSIPLTLDGTWQLLRAELAGEEAPELVTTHTTLEIGSGTYRVLYQGEIVDRGLLELGSAVALATLVLHGKAGPNAGRTIPCIYQLRGDMLRVCFGLDGTAPTEFATDDKNGRYLATYRRTAVVRG